MILSARHRDKILELAKSEGWTRLGWMPGTDDLVGNPPDLPDEDGFFCYLYKGRYCGNTTQRQGLGRQEHA